MCGICGKIFFDKSHSVDEKTIKIMTSTMSHRGPDDDGFFISRQVGLGHRRLSIIDLNTGKQPISNEDNSIWIVFNGEIYNYQELRKNLIARNHLFKTATDTEVIVHAYEEYGVDVLSHLRGMFAFAIWDEKNKSLFLARDRVGIKPLYYYLTSDSLIFASEIKAVLADPSVKADINYPAIDRFLTYRYLPGNDTLIKNLVKLSPGHYLFLKNGVASIQQYWDLKFSKPNNHHSIQSYKEELLDLLKETLRIHMISDVPVGFLLSGGVDSTALLNLYAEGENRDLSTFTIGFAGEKFDDERKYGRLAAEKVGTRHYEMTIDANSFFEFLPQYVWHMEEPVCEPPAIALYYISKLAKEHVKVLISGEGGDEAFAGYQTYRNLIWLERVKHLTGPFDHNIAALFNKLSHFPFLKRLNKYASLIPLPLEDYYYSRTATPFSFFNAEFKHSYTSKLQGLTDKRYSTKPTTDLFKNVQSQDKLSQMLYVDTKTWLPDDLLIKADKITMANSIELRVPLLDHKVLEFAAGLPSDLKVRGFTTKYLLKETFRDRIPREIIRRKKTGFPVPFTSWLKNELRSYVSDILLDKKTIQRGYFDGKAIEKMLLENQSNSAYASEIFSLVVLELWHRTFIDTGSKTNNFLKQN